MNHFRRGMRTKALLMAGWMLANAPGQVFASSFAQASRAVGTGAIDLGMIVKQDYHPENLFISGYYSNGSAAGGTSGGATAANQPDITQTGGTLNPGLGSHPQVAGGEVLHTVGQATATYGGSTAVVSGQNAGTPGTAGPLAQWGAGQVADDALNVSGAVADIGGEAAASALSVIGVVFLAVAIFDLFGSGVDYSWSGSCAARTGAPCGGYYESEGYTHAGFGLYVPKAALSSMTTDTANLQLGATINDVMGDVNSDPSAFFDATGHKLKGNFSIYTDQGPNLLQGYHPPVGSVLMSNTAQNQPGGWVPEQVTKGFGGAPYFMYTYDPRAAWTGN